MTGSGIGYQRAHRENTSHSKYVRGNLIQKFGYRSTGRTEKTATTEKRVGERPQQDQTGSARRGVMAATWRPRVRRSPRASSFPSVWLR